MRTLHVGLRVADPERSIAFYTSLGYEVLGGVPETELDSLTMLKLPGDEFVSLELVQWPAGHPAGMTVSDLSGPGGS
jgi:lactoylglutathione lyase